MNGEMINTTASAPTTGPRAKCDQVIFEALAKATEIIVSSRGGGNSLNHQPSQQQQQHVFGGVFQSRASTDPVPTTSSRFNLTIPENIGLRGILQRWRRALHLPIRLDVYYEHEDNRRELLERWCLEYVIGDAFWRDQHNAMLSKNSSDPIVQLRHVCKKIVIWLRTLYCFARLLPSSAFLSAKMQSTAVGGGMRGAPYTDNATNSTPSSRLSVGFSLYAVSEDSADVAQLKEQGFLHQVQPSSAVSTPYGELSWQVLYAPSNTVERLVPRTANSAGKILRPATSQAIPIAGGGRGGVQNHLSNHFDGAAAACPANISEPGMLVQGGVPQSAPAHMHTHLMHERTRADYRQTSDRNRYSAVPQQNTYNPSFFTERNRRLSDDHVKQKQQHQRPIPPHGLLQRRHTSGQEIVEGYSTNDSTTMEKGGQPQRVRSGLSLALMMSENNNEDMNNGDPSAAHTTTNAANNTENNHDADTAAEKRRAALHQMPPHLQQQQPPVATRSMSNEYGYAYNNHIPWQKLRSEAGQPGDGPSSEARVSTVRNQPTPPAIATSPLLGTTPPSGAFLGSVDPNVTPPPQLISLGSLIPPRNASAGVAPPFATRPPGFAQDHYVISSSGAAAASSAGAQVQQQDIPQRQLQRDAEKDPQLTSLDMLHHSPFLFGPHHGGSMLSSLSGGAGVFGSEATSLFYNSVGADFRKSATGGITSALPSEEYEEMPFAVDQSLTENNAPLSSPSASSSSHILASSAAVASFAQKCSMHQRLELFDQAPPPCSENGDGKGAEGGTKGMDQDINQLADQLADFRSFGASLRLSTGTVPPGAGEVENATTTSSSTPISLRT